MPVYFKVSFLLQNKTQVQKIVLPWQVKDKALLLHWLGSQVQSLAWKLLNGVGTANTTPPKKWLFLMLSQQPLMLNTHIYLFTDSCKVVIPKFYHFFKFICLNTFPKRPYHCLASMHSPKKRKDTYLISLLYLLVFKIRNRLPIIF